jgi:hypothetical protein
MYPGKQPTILLHGVNQRNDIFSFEVSAPLSALPLLEFTRQVNIQRLIPAVPTGEMDLAILCGDGCGPHSYQFQKRQGHRVHLRSSVDKPTPSIHVHIPY